LLKTANAASPVAASQVMTSLVGFILVYGLLGYRRFLPDRRFSPKKGPETGNGKQLNQANDWTLNQQRRNTGVLNGITIRMVFSSGACSGPSFS
jgi:hypothetical protein